jgi:7-cyano-7-deazaguanine synthase
MSLIAVKSSVAVLFSGGLDSSILLAHLVAEEHRVQPVYIDSGLYWQADELRYACRFLRAIDAVLLDDLVVLKLPLADLYVNHWSVTGQDVPGAQDPDDHVYLPGRNPLLMVKAQVWCRLNGVEQLALGALSGNPFADATELFFRQFESAMDRAVSGHVELVRPFAMFTKRQVMQLGRFAPLESTFSCLAPTAGKHCGECNKCAERLLAFREAGIPDSTQYAVNAPMA